MKKQKIQKCDKYGTKKKKKTRNDAQYRGSFYPRKKTRAKGGGNFGDETARAGHTRSNDV